MLFAREKPWHDTTEFKSIVGMILIRPCEPSDVPMIYKIINESAHAYKGVIPADRWHEPYMPLSELTSEIAHGVRFHGSHVDGRMVGVMGIQDVEDVTLLRHAYVRTEFRNQGIGRSLIEHMNRLVSRPMLVGTWKAASWAVRFYERNGFVLVDEEEKDRLLRKYWTIPDRQIEESVVLVNSQWLDHARAILKEDALPPNRADG